jgi:4-hydroxy-tetrahydrodipicolinate reductase
MDLKDLDKGFLDELISEMETELFAELDKDVQVVVFGLGEIGLGVVREVLNRPKMNLVGAVDSDKGKINKDVGVLAGVGTLGIPVVASLKGLPAEIPTPKIIVHTAVSWHSEAIAHIKKFIKAGFNVVTSAEELFDLNEENFPDFNALTRDAAMAKLSIIATGVNPGFVFDVLPLHLSKVCTSVRAIKMERVVDASTRRAALQKKIGAGLTLMEYKARTKNGKMGHAGFTRSIGFLAAQLGWIPVEIRENLVPVLADQEIRTHCLTVLPGQVAGIHQTCQAVYQHKVLIEADLKMYVGAPDPHDHILIDGDPPINCRFEGGIDGDEATVGILVNTIETTVFGGGGIWSPTEINLGSGTGNGVI